MVFHRITSYNVCYTKLLRMIDILFSDEAAAIRKIVNSFDRTLVGKLIDIFENIPFVEEWQLEKFNEIANEKFENFQTTHEDT